MWQIITEVQIKTTMKYHLISVSMDVILRRTVGVRDDAEKLEPLHTVGMKIGTVAVESNTKIKQLKIQLRIQPIHF